MCEKKTYPQAIHDTFLVPDLVLRRRGGKDNRCKVCLMGKIPNCRILLNVKFVS